MNLVVVYVVLLVRRTGFDSENQKTFRIRTVIGLETRMVEHNNLLLY